MSNENMTFESFMDYLDDMMIVEEKFLGIGSAVPEQFKGIDNEMKETLDAANRASDPKERLKGYKKVNTRITNLMNKLESSAADNPKDEKARNKYLRYLDALKAGVETDIEETTQKIIKSEK